jgi:soluble epoxide hydrolase / lipid-phosphate phosphatase
MTAPLNYYRTTELRYTEEYCQWGFDQLDYQLTFNKALNLPAQLPQFPWLFIYGGKDKTCNDRLVEAMSKFVPQVKVVKLEGKSHWVMIEAKEEVSKLVLDFVKGNLELSNESYEADVSKL